MTYFSNFPVTTIDGTSIVRDIIKRVQISSSTKKSKVMFEKYQIRDGQKPEDVAFEVYGRPELHWLVLLVAEMQNPYLDWPRSDKEFDRYIQKNYSSKRYGIRITPNTAWIIGNLNNIEGDDTVVLNDLSYPVVTPSGSEAVLVGVFEYAGNWYIGLNGISGTIDTENGDTITQAGGTGFEASWSQGQVTTQFQEGFITDGTEIATRIFGGTESFKITGWDSDIQFLETTVSEGTVLANAFNGNLQDPVPFITNQGRVFAISPSPIGSPSVLPYEFVPKLYQSIPIPIEGTDKEEVLTVQRNPDDINSLARENQFLSIIDFLREENQKKSTIFVLKPEYAREVEEQIRAVLLTQ